MEISAETVRHVAGLARLQLTDDEVNEFKDQLTQILSRAQRIQNIPLDDVEPTHHALELRNVLREDEVVVFPEPEKILEGAPQRENEFFRVPKILEDQS